MLKTQIIGNIGKDAEIRNVNGSNAISFSVAHTDKFKDRDGFAKERTTWINCTLWRHEGKSTLIAEYLKKGTQVFVEGEISTRAYMTNTGEAASQLELRVNEVKLLGGRSESAPQEPSDALQRAAQKLNNVLNPSNYNDLPF